MEVTSGSRNLRPIGIGVAILALLLAIAQILSVATVMSMGTSGADRARGPELSGFLAAARAPEGFLAYKASMAFAWALMGSLLFCMAAFFKGKQPVKAGILATLGAFQVFGLFSELTGFIGVSKLTSFYGTAEATLRPMIERDFLVLNYLADSGFFIAQGSIGLGFLVLAALTFSSRTFPKWLASIFAVAALPALVLALSTLNQSYLIPVILANVLFTTLLFVLVFAVFIRGQSRVYTSQT